MKLLAALPDWFTSWGWIVLVVSVGALVGAIVGLCIYKRKSKSEKSGQARLTDDGGKEAEQNVKEKKIAAQPEKPQTKSEKTEQKAEEDASAHENAGQDEEIAPENTEQEEDVVSESANKDDERLGKKSANKTYHIVKRKSDGKWQVKIAGGAKAIKLFSTQLEAINYAKKLAESQEAKIVIHKEDGAFRRLTYHNKK